MKVFGVAAGLAFGGFVLGGLFVFATPTAAAAESRCPAVTIECTGGDHGLGQSTGVDRVAANWARGLSDDPLPDFGKNPEAVPSSSVELDTADGGEFDFDPALDPVLELPPRNDVTPIDSFDENSGFFDPIVNPLAEPAADTNSGSSDADPGTAPIDNTDGNSSTEGDQPQELPLAEAREIYDAFRSPALISLRSRQDVSDDPTVNQVELEDVSRLTAGRTVIVIDALAEVGAFRRNGNPTTTSTIRTIRDVIPSDGLTADGYRAEIRRFSGELQPALDLLEANGVEVSPEVDQLAASLSPEILNSLEAGETAVVDPELWLDGLVDLVVRDGEGPVPPADRSGDRAAVMAVVAAVAGIEFDRAFPADNADQAAGTAGSSEGLADSLLATVLITTIVALAVALTVVRRRTVPVAEIPTPGRPPRLSITDLLDASRRMTASLDPDEIGTIVMSETKRLVSAEGCIIALREGKGLRAMHHEPAELFRPDVLMDPDAPESCLRRVVETGQATVMVASDEPVLGEVPMALIAVPIVVDGSVAGAVLIVRVSTRPFDRDDVEAMEMLAPMLGTALRSAAAHGSATALAETEPLTGLKNRRRLEQDLASLDDEPKVSYIMIDVDHFKNFNDVNGHAAGDEALKRVARVLEASVRPGDLVYRYGGEEFCMLLPNVTRHDALRVAERVRLAVEAAEIPGGESQPAGMVTVSVGVACDGPAEALVERADAALYEAKRQGRNRVKVAQTV